MPGPRPVIVSTDDVVTAALTAIDGRFDHGLAPKKAISKKAVQNSTAMSILPAAILATVLEVPSW